jgi:hypothetical protein
MRGIETKYLLEIILAVAIISILVIVVVLPSIVFGKQQGGQITFREFCLHWSIVGYKCGTSSSENPDLLTIGTYSYSISEQCSKVNAPDPCHEYDVLPAGTDPVCVKMCKGTT